MGEQQRGNVPGSNGSATVESGFDSHLVHDIYGMKHLNLFEAFDAEETVALVHTTTNTIARKIEAEGFVPTPFLDYKYYSELGKEGIYFYDGWDTRNVQSYGYFLKQKTKVESVALVYVQVPRRCTRVGVKLQDGVFVPGEYLGEVVVQRVRYNVQPSALY